MIELVVPVKVTYFENCFEPELPHVIDVGAGNGLTLTAAATHVTATMIAKIG